MDMKCESYTTFLYFNPITEISIDNIFNLNAEFQNKNNECKKKKHSQTHASIFLSLNFQRILFHQRMQIE